MLEQNDAGQITVQICGGGHDDRFAKLNLATGLISEIDENQSEENNEANACELRTATHWTTAVKILSLDRDLTSLHPKLIIYRNLDFLYSTSPPLPARGPPSLL